MLTKYAVIILPLSGSFFQCLEKKVLAIMLGGQDYFAKRGFLVDKRKEKTLLIWSIDIAPN